MPLTGQAQIENLRGGAAILGVLALATSAWLFRALKRGRTLYLSKFEPPHVVDRRSDPLSYWAMIVAISMVLLFLIVGAVWLLISN